MGGRDKRWQEDNEPPFTDELSDAQVSEGSGKGIPITEGPTAVSYPTDTPAPSNPGPKPGQGRKD